MARKLVREEKEKAIQALKQQAEEEELREAQEAFDKIAKIQANIRGKLAREQVKQEK